MPEAERPRARRIGLWVAAVVGGGVVAGAGLFGATALWGSADPPQAGGPPVLVETTSSGIDHVYDGEFTFFVGGGVAILDCDGNGLPDAYFAGGSNPASLYRNTSDIGGDLRFAAIADPASELENVTGAYPLNIDGDAHTDLVVLRLGENVLLRGVGDCSFERANEAWGFDGGTEWTAAFSAKWEEASALPTMAFGNYLAIDDSGEQTGECAPNSLLRPVGSGYSVAAELAPGWCTLSILFSDWDRSGRGDLRVTNDRHYYRDGQDQLWRVAAGEAPRLYTEADGWNSIQIWGMGIASSDVTGDGLPEFFLTSQGDNKLRTLDGSPTQPSYEDIAIRRGVTAHRPFIGDQTLPSTAWHPEFQDINNDTYIDLYISKGNVEAMPEYAAADPSNLLLGQPDGTFVEGADGAGLVSLGKSRGGAIVDFNLDGLLDLVEVNRREQVKLWRNMGSGTATEPAPLGNWVAIRLHNSGGNIDGIGSWIQVRHGDRTVEREVTIGGGHAGGQLGWIHIGLAGNDSADIRVLWPDGDMGPWVKIDANGFAVIERATGEARPWTPQSG